MCIINLAPLLAQLLVWATGQIDEVLHLKSELVLEEKADASLHELRAALLVSVALRGASGWRFELKVLEMWDDSKQGFDII